MLIRIRSHYVLLSCDRPDISSFVEMAFNNIYFKCSWQDH